MTDILTGSNILFMLDGLKLTLIISIVTIILSTVFGGILALLCNYAKHGIWKVFAGIARVYIEFFRCTPNVLWIFVFRFTLKGNPVVIGIFTFTLFTSAVTAEIIRGGLNGIPKGQFESAAAQGFSFPQTLIFIILPQTFRAIIPSLLSQMTTIIKDTSYLKAVDIHEFMRNSSIVLGSARGIGQITLLYGFILLTYFVLNFSLSIIIRKYHSSIKIA